MTETYKTDFTDAAWYMTYLPGGDVAFEGPAGLDLSDLPKSIPARKLTFVTIKQDGMPTLAPHRFHSRGMMGTVVLARECLPFLGKAKPKMVEYLENIWNEVVKKLVEHAEGQKRIHIGTEAEAEALAAQKEKVDAAVAGARPSIITQP